MGLRGEWNHRSQGSKVNVLIVGSGGREHTLLWSFSNSNVVGRVYIAPGNGGTTAHNVNIDSENFEELCRFAREHDCLTVVGPEKPLAQGMVDYFRARNLLTFGPTKQQARLESSKVYAKEFMKANGIPTADFEVFNDSKAAIEYAKTKNWKVVVKVDGLADGKGVFVCSSKEEAEAAISSILDKKLFGSAGNRIVVEDRLYGKELSVFALCDGKSAIYIGSAVDHKQLRDGGKGPNTGGMGAYSPATEFSPELIDEIIRRVVRPTAEKIGLSGFLYVGLMITKDGPMVLEFNLRFGDPEAQVIIPRFRFDLLGEIYSIAKGGNIEVRPADIFNELHATCVVMCSEGYPFDHKDKFGREIDGVTNASLLNNTIIFHAGTKLEGGRLLTNGGRVLDVIGLGSTLHESRTKAYEAVNLVSFKGEQHRTDIGIGFKQIRVKQ